ncbi:hypothetical protein [Pseudofrankia inefficax]|uniref:hypothetical protein n=1 Tax=Pseudofrankia inefficax (strain DSM 45817 / CECT 9037 / DDB 130130 / EuI1c) TaxID=298654 RepID=UPI0012FE4911|nr:hypothetical protein [Pseudofrankia inefficax]
MASLPYGLRAAVARILNRDLAEISTSESPPAGDRLPRPDESDLYADRMLLRARSAYLRRADREGFTPDVVDRASSTVEIDKGIGYAVLRNSDGVITVYREGEAGKLVRRKTWPAAFDHPG